MANKLFIGAEWEPLERGVPEERATFAAIEIALNDVWLTEADDTIAGRVRHDIHLSAYRLAEWFAWNWWRLRWEPFRRSKDWRAAHRMASIGGGFVWPNITFFSDGMRVIIDAQPTEQTPSEPVRYIKQYTRDIEANAFETAIDSFVDRICAKLFSEKIQDTNLQLTWRDVQEERVDPDATKRRRMEAILGWDPDEGDPTLIERLIEDGSALGAIAIQEVAAAYPNSQPPSKDEIVTWANSLGTRRDPRNTVKLVDRSEGALPTGVEAWRRGKAAARALRKQEGFGDHPIQTPVLCELVGSTTSLVKKHDEVAPFSFSFDENVANGKIVLRGKHESSRRFDVARLLGDRLACPSSGRLEAVTTADTYRQKLQRSFAAEFLSPFQVIDDMLEGDFSEEKIEGVAQHFEVSPLSIRASLANNHRIGRDEVWAYD